jgi:hypothetical protein
MIDPVSFSRDRAEPAMRGSAEVPAPLTEDTLDWSCKAWAV